MRSWGGEKGSSCPEETGAEEEEEEEEEEEDEGGTDELLESSDDDDDDEAAEAAPSQTDFQNPATQASISPTIPGSRESRKRCRIRSTIAGGANRAQVITSVGVRTVSTASFLITPRFRERRSGDSELRGGRPRCCWSCCCSAKE